MKVKKLEWGDGEYNYWWVEYRLANYGIRMEDYNFHNEYGMYRVFHYHIEAQDYVYCTELGAYGSIEDAKQAAQEHFEGLLREHLEDEYTE